VSGKLVLGLGGTVDYEVAWDSGVLEGLVVEYGIRAAELTTTIAIESERDLVVALLGFVKDGAGGERYVANSQLIERFAARFDKRITLGGTCVRAALAMRVLDVTCTLHLVSIDDHVRRLLPEGCDYICSATEDTTDPHLIVQFAPGAAVRAGDIDIRSPHANRIIFANDPPNRELVLSTDLGAVLADAAVFMVAGFNVIRDRALLDDRLAQLREHMKQLPPDSTVFYEDAGYHVAGMKERVREQLTGLIDIHSMNEDEMQAYLGRTLDLLDPAELTAALAELRVLVPARTLVVHTRYWALAMGEGAAGQAAALQGGITMAGTRYRHGDAFTAADYAALERSPRHAGGVAVAAGIAERMGDSVVCVAAYDLDVAHPTTIGLGDTFVGGYLAAMTRKV
jgi:ADP-dependent phosphofructokinase/glucokinase